MTDTIPSRLPAALALRPAALLRALPLRLPALGAVVRPLDLLSRMRGLSDRRLRSVIDVPVLERDPAETAEAALRTQVGALLADCASGAGASDLLDLLHGWDAARSATPFGRRKARLALAQMLGSDIGNRLAAETPEHPAAAALAVQSSLMQGGGALARAEALLDGFDPAACGSPLLAEGQYRLSALMAEGLAALQDAHDDWADLDPSDRAVWHGHARRMMAQGAGAAEVAAAAARCEWQTERFWGKGGYALFLMPVMDLDVTLWDRIDPERLAAAALDLARHRRKDQGAVNRLAAAWHALEPMAPAGLQGLMRTTWRQMLEETVNALVPAAWQGGETAARRQIAAAFGPEIRAGARLRATPAGLALCDRSAT
jgi:hypothetical protein